MVRERQATGRRSVELVIDVDREAHPDAAETDSLEELIRVGASIGRQFHAHHANVSVRLGGQTIVVSPGPVGLNRLLDWLRALDAGWHWQLVCQCGLRPDATPTAFWRDRFERQTDLHAHAKPWAWHRKLQKSKALHGRTTSPAGRGDDRRGRRAMEERTLEKPRCPTRRTAIRTSPNGNWGGSTDARSFIARSRA